LTNEKIGFLYEKVLTTIKLYGIIRYTQIKGGNYQMTNYYVQEIGEALETMQGAITFDDTTNRMRVIIEDTTFSEEDVKTGTSDYPIFSLLYKVKIALDYLEWLADSIEIGSEFRTYRFEDGTEIDIGWRSCLFD
jgi:hypothetical protein